MYPAVIGIIAYIQLVDRQKIRGTEKQASLRRFGEYLVSMGAMV
jgi:hypothetical protein